MLRLDPLEGDAAAAAAAGEIDQAPGEVNPAPRASAAAIRRILAGARQTMAGKVDSTRVTLPDGTEITLVGVCRIDLSFFGRFSAPVPAPAEVHGIAATKRRPRHKNSRRSPAPPVAVF